MLKQRINLKVKENIGYTCRLRSRDNDAIATLRNAALLLLPILLTVDLLKI